MLEGQIVKALSGFYYVKEKNRDTVWQCRARGVFKKKNVQPLVGDYVQFEPNDSNQSADIELPEGTVTKVLPRKNELVRPPIANVDQALLVFSIDEPQFSALMLDKLLVHIEKANITPVICLSKLDLDSQFGQKEVDVYKEIGYELYLTSSITEQGLQSIIDVLKHKVTVIAGPSGVGKSTLLNKIHPELSLETGAVSLKIGRGRHTTRHVELISLPQGGVVADTPGFSQLDFSSIEPETLSDYFIEFRALREQCKFRECMHHKEPHCAVKQAVESGDVAQFRYDHYLLLLTELIQNKQRKRY